jgi:hypothetical protein
VAIPAAAPTARHKVSPGAPKPGAGPVRLLPRRSAGSTAGSEAGARATAGRRHDVACSGGAKPYGARCVWADGSRRSYRRLGGACLRQRVRRVDALADHSYGRPDPALALSDRADPRVLPDHLRSGYRGVEAAHPGRLCAALRRLAGGPDRLAPRPGRGGWSRPGFT